MRILKAIIECSTPLHCGGGEDEIQDQPVIRDAFNFWRIPGSSLAGSLRAMAEKLDEKLALKLFGRQEDDSSNASLVWCEDGLLLDFDGKPALAKTLSGEKTTIQCSPFVRDHVRLDLERSAAVEGGKFDAEIVPTGARFLLEFRCDGWSRPLTAEEADFFDQLVRRILAGELSIGGKTGLGYGLYNIVAFDYRHFDLSKTDDMEEWLNRNIFDVPKSDCKKPAGVPASSSAGLDGWLEIPLSCNGPCLIGGGNPLRPDGGMSEADMVFALTPRLNYSKKGSTLLWEAVLPASSIRGVLRHAIYRVLQARKVSSEKILELLNNLFGFIEGDKGRCGKLVMTDCRLVSEKEDPNFQYEQHVALDRFTGAALDGALFSEEPFWNPGAQAILRMRASQLEAHEAALFLHAIIDLFEGGLAFGSGANRGNGRLELAGWRKDPQAALKSVSGDLAWNGDKIFVDGNGMDNLAKFAPEWDAALLRVQS